MECLRLNGRSNQLTDISCSVLGGRRQSIRERKDWDGRHRWGGFAGHVALGFVAVALQIANRGCVVIESALHLMLLAGGFVLLYDFTCGPWWWLLIIGVCLATVGKSIVVVFRLTK